MLAGSRSCKSSYPVSLAVAKSEILWNDLELLNQDQIPQKRAWLFWS